MAHYDETTLDFIDKIAGTIRKKKPAEPVVAPETVTHDAGTILRQGISLARKAVSNKSPVETGIRMAVRAGAHHFLEDELEKKGEVTASVLNIYKDLNEKYKREWWDWEPETLWRSVRDDLGHVPSDDLKNIILALQTILKTNFAHEQWHIFENVGNAFNRNNVNFSILQPLELNEIALTLQILNQIRPKTEYEHEVDGYIAAAAKNAGVVFLPMEWFGKGPQVILDELNNELDLKASVAKLWEAKTLPTDKRLTLAEKVQLLRLQEIGDYLTNA